MVMIRFGIMEMIIKRGRMRNCLNPLVYLLLCTVDIMACDKQDNAVLEGDGSLKIQLTANVEPVGIGTTSRTSIGTYNGTSNTILWGENESMKMAVLGDDDVRKDTWASATTSDYNGQPRATFIFSLATRPNKTGTSYTYVGLYPASASVDESSVTEHRVNLKKIQDATESSYDPDAYILVARPETRHNASNANWDAYFRRATAQNRITLKNIPEPIESVEFIAPSGENLTGGRYVDLSTGNSDGFYSGDNTVTINYNTPNAGLDEEGVNCKTIWFTSWEIGQIAD